MKHLSRMNRAIEFQRNALIENNKTLQKAIYDNWKKLGELNNEYHSNNDQYIKLKSKV